RGLGFAGAWLLKGWHSTLRLRQDCAASGGLPIAPRRQRFIYAFWHENIFIGTHYGVQSEVLVSRHGDGEWIAQIIRHMRMDVVRGSSRRGGIGALLEIIR